jgi:hypothetical protein
MPAEAQQAMQQPAGEQAEGGQYAQGDLNPFQRGPEITERR